jgi:hypothetical protein
MPLRPAHTAKASHAGPETFHTVSQGGLPHPWRGLYQAQVEQRLQAYGPNQMPQDAPRGWLGLHLASEREQPWCRFVRLLGWWGGAGSSSAWPAWAGWALAALGVVYLARFLAVRIQEYRGKGAQDYDRLCDFERLGPSGP